MRVPQILFCVNCCVLLQCFALNCRTSGGPSIEELKTTYKNCLKRQDNRSSNNSGSSEESSKTRRPQGSQGRHNNNDDWSTLGDFAGHSAGAAPGSSGDWSDGSRNSYDRSRSNDRNMNANGNGYPYSRNGNTMGGSGNSMGGSGNGMGRNNDQVYMNSDHMTGTGYMDQQQYGTGQDMSRYNYPRTTMAQQNQRYSRGIASHRSQYNPNTSWKSTTLGREDTYKDDQSGSSENMTRKEDKKACALHCFMQEFDMIGDNDMPDKHMVVQALIKYATNEELKDFLQEAVEECFQIVYNENTKDKCEFSKNLGVCLSEKGRANCDDWKEELTL